MSRILTSVFLVAAAIAAGQPELSAQTQRRLPTLPPALDSVRAKLAKYQDPIVAIHDGYLSTVACVTFPSPGRAGETPFPAGSMGVHLLNPGLIGPQLDPARPIVLIYEPYGDTLRLVAAEWFVPTAVTKERPQLFGKQFDGPMPGHQPIMPESLEHWDLHVWLWRENPAGLYTPTNPALRCPASVNTIHMHD